MVGQQQDDLAVPPAQPDPAAVRAQQGFVTAQHGQLGRLGPGPLGSEQRQLGLRGTRHGLDETQAVRVGQAVSAGDVHGTEHPPGAGVVHRSGGAGPGLDPAYEVLGREDLYRSADGHRRARRIRADGRLRPAGPGHEVHPARPAPGGRMPLDPQQPAVRVAHREQMLAVGRERTQELTDQRHHPRQRVFGPVGAEVAVHQLHARRAVRADPRLDGPPPRVRHHRTHGPRHRPGLGERLVGPTQRPGPLHGVGPRFQSQP